MILPTYTYDELDKCLSRVTDILVDRAHGFAISNQERILKSLRKIGRYTREFSAEIDGQRYYQVFNFELNDDSLFFGGGSVVSELVDNQRRFVIAYFKDAGQTCDDSRKLRLFTGHFLERYSERVRIEGIKSDLCHICLCVLSSSETIVPASVDDDVIRRYGKPSLKLRCLPLGERSTECVYRSNGDIAIVERYGPVSVWRTYITKDMLFESQVNAIEKLGVDKIHKQLST